MMVHSIKICKISKTTHAQNDQRNENEDYDTFSSPATNLCGLQIETFDIPMTSPGSGKMHHRARCAVLVHI